mgnify:FL=1|tara:strand:- start:2218 stop:2424 length:207 start_codon:yes stop_codon:yes gene_type:complete
MADLVEKMESLQNMKPELVAEGLDELQLELAKQSYQNALEIWESQVQNLQDRIDGKEVLVEEAVEEEE